MTNNDKTKNYESSDDGNENEKNYIYIYRDRWMHDGIKKKKNDSKRNQIKMKNKKMYIYTQYIKCIYISWHILNDGRWKISHVHFLELVLSAHLEREQG